MRLIVFQLIAIALCSQLFGQTDSRPAFEVAAIKPAPPDEAGGGYRFEPGGRIIISNFTLKNLVMVAWHVQDFQVAGGPSWLDSDRYDIEAKARGDPGESASRIMLQSLLIERFGLRLHTATREHSGYVLLPAHGNRPAALASSKQGSCAISAMDFPPQRKGGEPPYCGFTQKLKRSASGGRTMELHGSGITLSMFARVLGNILDLPVKDLTDIGGRFDIVLEFADTNPVVETNVSGPSLFTAVQEQLGLKLESRQVPIEILTLDGGRKPTPN